MIHDIHRAIALAKEQKTAVVIGVPFDLQQDVYHGTLDQPLSDDIISLSEPCQPQDDDIMQAAEWVNEAKRPILLAGLGAVDAQAHRACLAFADKAGALLATTLPAGVFSSSRLFTWDGRGLCNRGCQKDVAESDLVIAVGARLAHHAFNGGALSSPCTRDSGDLNRN